jgi:polyphosphate kinase
MADNVQAWEMDSDGTYTRRKSRAAPHCAQLELMALMGRTGGA